MKIMKSVTIVFLAVVLLALFVVASAYTSNLFTGKANAALAQKNCKIDKDKDGYISGVCKEGTDCDDKDPSINPNANEICTNGIDDDCDGLIDSNDSDCAPSAPTSVMTIAFPLFSKSWPGLQIKWNEVQGATYYKLGWNNDDSRNFTEISPITEIEYYPETWVFYYHRNLIEMWYYYSVKACNSQDICSEWSFISNPGDSGSGSGNVPGDPSGRTTDI